MDATLASYGFNHTVCEGCWFSISPGRFPIQLVRKQGDNLVDQCCLCGTFKVTRIWVRLDPRETELRCTEGAHSGD